MKVSLAKAIQNLCSLLFEGPFSLFHDCGESGSIDDSEVSKDLTIELDVSSLQAFDEAGVG